MALLVAARRAESGDKTRSTVTCRRTGVARRITAIASVVLLCLSVSGTVTAPPVRVTAVAETTSTVPGDGLRWFYFSDTGTGPVVHDVTFGEPGDIPLIWKWVWWSMTGQHVARAPAVYRNGSFLFETGYNLSPVPNRWRVVHFGDPGDYPLIWNLDKFAVYRNATFYLSNDDSVSSPEQYLGAADVTADYGNPGDVPLMGHWNGDVVGDAIGVYRPSNATFYLRNSNTSGVADLTFVYGDPGDVPLVGDWNRDGIITMGVYRPSTATFYLRNSNTSGVADVTFVFGNPGDYPVAPAPFGDADDGVAVVRLSS